ncbi:metallopeptidase MepB [Aureobasidium sp. EXF-3400]|nr:metallopeptidase MepB [Aureobasidium sp. EXF-12344]KAI4780346.1 metallopeptidase MepB [Aureobasidium sp. EXF-3400]
MYEKKNLGRSMSGTKASKTKSPPQARALFVTTAKSIADRTTQLIETSRQALDQIVAQTSLESANFENVLLPLAHCRNNIAAEAGLLSFYKEVSSDISLRDESSKSNLLLDNFNSEIAMREDLFVIIDSVVKRNEALDSESERLLRKEHRTFYDNGLGLPAAARDRFNEIKTRINTITSEFRRNMNEENEYVDFTAQDLVGAPSHVLQSAMPDHGSDENEEVFRLTFQPSHFYPTMRYAQSAEARKRYMTGFENRCANNVPLFREMVLLRDEAARMLDYASHAEWRTEGLMAGTPEHVNIFLGDLRSQLQSGLQSDLNALKQLKSDHLAGQGIDFDGKFYVWDISFYHRLMLETQYAVDQKRIAEYFPIQTVVPAMLNNFEKVFGLVFREVSGDTSNLKVLNQIWHEDVRVFDVWDSDDIGGSFLGFLYLDLYDREGKYGSAANFNLQPVCNLNMLDRGTTADQVQGYIKPDGSRHFPSTALICNFEKPTLDKPSLLQHSDVSLIFHELGHGIHDLVAKTKYSRFHGTATADDFCEAPSQMLERWCWREPQLKALSHHYSTLTPEYHDYWRTHGCTADPDPPREISTELLEGLIRSENVNASLTNMRALWRSVFDMKVHNPPDRMTLENMNITCEFNRLQGQIVGLDQPEDEEWGHGQAHFSHLIGGYDASYYGYLYSRVYASDMFSTAFSADPMSREVGIRYRRSVLEKGGSVDEMSLLTEFLGRKPNAHAFHDELGITI